MHGPDPLLRRPARRRQDVARPVDRARARPQVRAHLARRRARRGRDPRPPPHLHRRDARARSSGRCATPSSTNPVFMLDEIDKMGADFRGDPAQRDARGARPGAERHVPRPLPRRAVRPLARCCSSPPRTCSTRSRRRCSTAWRSSSSPATPRRRSSHIATRYLVPRQIEAQRPEGRRRSTFTDDGAARDHRASTRARPACATSSARSARSAARSRREVAEGDDARRVDGRRRSGCASCSGRAAFSREARRADQRARAWRPASPGRRSAATCCSSRRRAMPGTGKLTLTGQLGDVMKESAQAALSCVRGARRRARRSTSTTTGSPSTTSTSTCPAGAIPKDGPSAGVTMATALVSLLTRPAGARRRRDDRRDHADRPGAADRRR